MDALRALRDKRDTRHYTDEPIETDLLGSVLQAARMAGSAKNRQPVRMVVVRESAAKLGLTAAGDFSSWIDASPVVVVVTVRADAGPRAMFDVGRHAQNLMVAAHASGLASCPVTIHHPDVARELLDIPDDVTPAMIVTLGWPSSDDRPVSVAGPRVTLDEYVHWDRWT